MKLVQLWSVSYSLSLEERFDLSRQQGPQTWDELGGNQWLYWKKEKIQDFAISLTHVWVSAGFYQTESLFSFEQTCNLLWLCKHGSVLWSDELVCVCFCQDTRAVCDGSIFSVSLVFTAFKLSAEPWRYRVFHFNSAHSSFLAGFRFILLVQCYFLVGRRPCFYFLCTKKNRSLNTCPAVALWSSSRSCGVPARRGGRQRATETQTLQHWHFWGAAGRQPGAGVFGRTVCPRRGQGDLWEWWKDGECLIFLLFFLHFFTLFLAILIRDFVF